ncbi:MAG: LysR family transcriptional regulator [Candidatus Thiodiazotropha sp. (ex Ctena orbiculata)]|nr:LysR family transcriptional regulator [Candidatus Thiodiazotropha taylori]
MIDEREAFLAVVNARGFTAAANRLNTTPAAVSRRVKALEERLGIRLLQRTTRKVRLTSAGESYFADLQRIVHELNSVEDELSEASGKLSGDLKIAAPVSFGQRRLSKTVATFAKAHPAVKMSTLLDDKQTDLISEGIDVAIRISHLLDSSLIARPITPIHKYICASPEYIDRMGQPETVTDLLKHHCLHYSQISEREEWKFKTSKGEQSLSINPRHCSNNGDVLAEMACEGLGLTILPDFIVEEALATGKLVRVLKSAELVPLTLSVVYPSRKHLSARVKTLVDHLINELGD